MTGRKFFLWVNRLVKAFEEKNLGNGDVVTFKSLAMKECVDKIRRELKENVPEYMLPEKIISLDEMKYQANGKFDYMALQRMI